MDAVSKQLYDAVWRFDEEDGVAEIAAALAAGGDPMAIDQNGRPIAFMAACADTAAPLELLLEHGLDLNVRSGDGTLLHRAAAFGRVPIVKMLLARGLAVDSKDANGRTPLDCARAWKHGADAVPLLTKLTKATQKAKGGRAAEPGGDLHLADVTQAMKRLGKSDPLLRGVTQKRLTELVRAFFLALDPRLTITFLKELAGQDNEAYVAAALLLSSASRAKPTKLRLATLDGPLWHVGDVEITGDANAGVLVVTGNLKVTGKLSNYEGCVIGVGGNLTAKAIWSEGPFVVLGNVSAASAICGAYNDYGMRIGGTLTSPILVLDDHSLVAKRIAAQRYSGFSKIGAKDRAALTKALGPIGALTK